jgi:prepilin-type N-terminal cleavage/methylation domain-containing protein
MMHLKYQRGFTLIEMMVSVALFSMVMLVALGALLSMSVATRKAEGINSAVNNLSASIESMSRLVRTGANYHCGSGGTVSATQDCSTLPQPFFSFLSFDGSQVTYCLSNPGANTCNAATACGVGSCTILRSINSGPFVPLTAPEVNIRFFGFYVVGSTVGDTVQPKMSVLVSGSVPVTANLTSTFNIQTSVTQRIFDL